MKIKKRDWLLLSQLLMGSSVIGVIFSAIGYLGIDIWLASTQWLLIAALLAIFGIYARFNSN